MRRTAWKLACLTVISWMGGTSLAAQVEVSPISGTLVVIVPTRHGLVVAADRRSYDSKRGDLDATVKVVIAGQFAVVTATGYPTWLNDTTFEPLYEASSITASFFNQLDTHGSLRPYLAPVSNLLIDKFRELLAHTPTSQWPSAHDTRSNALFQVEVAHYDQQEKQLEFYNLVCLYRPHLLDPLQIVVDGATPEQLRDSEPLVYGNLKAYEELKDGHDSRFNRWRADKRIKRMLGRHVPVERVSREEGREFCRLLIEASAAITPIIDKSDNHIGSVADIGLLSPQGFTWLYRDKPIPE